MRKALPHLAPRNDAGLIKIFLVLGMAVGGCKAPPSTGTQSRGKLEAPPPKPSKKPPAPKQNLPAPPPKAPETPKAPAVATPAPSAATSPARAGNIEGLHFVERILGPQAAKELPVLVMIHGLGDRPESFLHLGDPLTHPHRALALRGLSEYSGSFGQGFAWFSTRVKDAKVDKLAAEINQAADRVAQGLVALNKKEGQPDRKFIVTGFSQGGILSYALAVQHPELIETAVPISGLLPVPSRKTKGNARPKIIAFHGESDTIVPFARAQQLGTWLRKTGFDYTFKSYPDVGHRIPPAMANPLRETLNHLLAPPKTP